MRGRSELPLLLKARDWAGSGHDFVKHFQNDQSIRFAIEGEDRYAASDEQRRHPIKQCSEARCSEIRGSEETSRMTQETNFDDASSEREVRVDP